jgi:hypothetical protein
MTAHGGVSKRDIQCGVADLDPMAAAAARNHDRIAPVFSADLFGEEFHNIGCVHHDRVLVLV